MAEAEIETQAEKYVREIYCKDCDGKKFCLASKCFDIHVKDYLAGAKWGMEHASIEAKEIIKDLLYCTDGIVTVSIPEEKRFLIVKELKARAEKFLKEVEE